MASLFHTLGPIHHYVRFRGASQFVYLGTAETSPLVDGDPSYLPVYNDIKSRTKPAQLIYDGSSEQITTVLNRLDLAVWRRCKDPQTHSSLLADQGYDSPLEVGSLVMGLGDFEVALVHGFYGTANATADLTQGYLYYNARVGNFQENSAGTRAFSAAVRFDCDSVRDASGNFKLKTEVLTGLTFPTPS